MGECHTRGLTKIIPIVFVKLRKVGFYGPIGLCWYLHYINFHGIRENFCYI